MDLMAELFNFLIDLPASQSPGERMAMVMATGYYPEIGNYLDWEGSNIEFFGRLLDVFGQRDKSQLVTFLQGMDQAPQVSDERKPVLATLRLRVEASNGVAWQQECATVPKKR